MPGLRGTTIGPFRRRSCPTARIDTSAFSAACNDLDMSINFHILSGPGKEQSLARSRCLLPTGVHKHKLDMMKAMGDLVISGVLERYPNLKVVVAEAGVGWIPFFAQEFDYYKNRFSGKAEALPRQPSDTSTARSSARSLATRCGGCSRGTARTHFMWSNDYPHPPALAALHAARSP